LIHTALVALLLGSFAPALRAQDALDCAPLFGHPEQEASLLRQAPHGASRPSPHRLIVSWSHGKRELVDQAPYQLGSQDGTHHLYCGYDHLSRLHLIYKADERAGFGLLLNDSTGEIFPGGERVLFSRDRARYLAFIQLDGMDGQVWRVYSRTGRRIWEGADCTPMGQSRFCTPLEAPRWNASGRLEADAVCPGVGDGPSVRTKVTLRLLDGNRRLTPAVICK
jgi:hypothetical protein